MEFKLKYDLTAMPSSLAVTITQNCAWYMNYHERGSVFKQFRNREEWLEWHEGGIARYSYDSLFRHNVDMLVERLMQGINYHLLKDCQYPDCLDDLHCPRQLMGGCRGPITY